MRHFCLWLAIATIGTGNSLGAAPARAQQGNASNATLPNAVEVTVSPPNPAAPMLSRAEFESQLQQSNFAGVVNLLEGQQASLFGRHLNLPLSGQLPTVEEIAATLRQSWLTTGLKPAAIYVSIQSDRLELFLIAPTELNLKASDDTASFVTLRVEVPEVDRDVLLATADRWRSQVATVGAGFDDRYLTASQQMYDWLLRPIAAELEAQEVDILVFALDSGLRSLPLAALHDGERFVGASYAAAIVPSFGLFDPGYRDVRETAIVAMGASEFTDQIPLPSVPTELEAVVSNPWSGRSFLNERFTLATFLEQNRRREYGIVHLATHGEFLPGAIEESYIQFSDRRLTMPEFRDAATELDWTTAETAPVELLVLSACRTAIGDERAELGFAGLAVQSGVKSALASLWYVSDFGTLALMSEFYRQLDEVPVKSEALRRTQQALLSGQVQIESGAIVLSNGTRVPLPPELAGSEGFDLSHPFFWSAFTLIGNWN